jgi:hypothetical protein
MDTKSINPVVNYRVKGRSGRVLFLRRHPWQGSTHARRRVSRVSSEVRTDVASSHGAVVLLGLQALLSRLPRWLEVTQAIDVAEHVPHVLDIAHLCVDNIVAIPMQFIMLRVSADKALERRLEGLIVVPAQELHEDDVKLLASRCPFELLDGLLALGHQLGCMTAAIPLAEKALRRENFLALDAIVAPRQGLQGLKGCLRLGRGRIWPAYGCRQSTSVQLAKLSRLLTNFVKMRL